MNAKCQILIKVCKNLLELPHSLLAQQKGVLIWERGMYTFKRKGKLEDEIVELEQ
jgi:hypothetical protein